MERLTLISQSLTPGDHFAGAGRRRITLVSDPARIGDKTAREAAQAVHDLFARLTELSAEVARLAGEVGKLEADAENAAVTGEGLDDLADQLTTARADLAKAQAKEAATKAARGTVLERYADAMAAATAFRGRVAKERVEWAQRAVELAGQAVEALYRAEDAHRMAQVVTDPYAPLRKPQDAPVDDLLAMIRTHLPKEPA